ncbi:DUF2987 domain-containing protein [Pseudoalteromonas piratica]|uniref:DUF2987 domain-containing protein n=1 Tax=Pseudoalteromonas piratica TaxID=1348114 RepID=UPI0006902BCC|nr:DUF2987 domain-containing protein [Pseudoalteromonas piratica]
MIKKNLAAGVVLSALSFCATASEFVVSYDGFYDRLKVMSKGNYATADLGFYLVNQKGEPCNIESGSIITKTNEYPLNYTSQSKLLLPFDETLDKDKALIVVHPKGGDQCQLKMQMEANQTYGDSISMKQMADLYSEFDDLIGRLSGFFMRTLFSFMMPEVKGVTLIFDQVVADPIGADESVKCTENRCTIVVPESYSQNQRFTFSQPITQVIPHIEK